MKQTTKKLICGAALLGIMLSAYAWKPLFVGHRGSYTGVMNTAEAFRNGILKYGYTGLECDVRTTRDGYYVISHDESTEKVGGSLVVANSTLAELLAETYRQTRSGQTYTGHLCTVDTFLQICVDHNAFPVLELKWSTGINNNDMSRFAGLYALIEKYGLTDRAIIFTSMKKSLEYVRTHYPQLQCQYLCYTLDEAKLAWCKQWGIHPSVQSGGMDLLWVKRCRDAGLQVAVWTINSEEAYRKHGAMGCSMMTCDYLYADAMPSLEDIDWDSIVLPEDTTTAIAVESVSLPVAHLDMTVGDTAYIDAVVLPENATDPSVSARVDKYRFIATSCSGKRIRLIASKACDATLTVTAGEHSAACTLHVSETPSAATNGVSVIDAPARIYDLSGREVGRTGDTLQRGIYIIRQGASSRKVFI